MATIGQPYTLGLWVAQPGREDELLVGWRNEPHVREWWDPDDPPMTFAAAIEEHRADTREGSPATACIIERGNEPIGFLQFYRWSDEPSDAEVLGISLDQEA